VDEVNSEIRNGSGVDKAYHRSFWIIYNTHLVPKPAGTTTPFSQNHSRGELPLPKSSPTCAPRPYSHASFNKEIVAQKWNSQCRWKWEWCSHRIYIIHTCTCMHNHTTNLQTFDNTQIRTLQSSIFPNNDNLDTFLKPSNLNAILAQSIILLLIPCDIDDVSPLIFSFSPLLAFDNISMTFSFATLSLLFPSHKFHAHGRLFFQPIHCQIKSSLQLINTIQL